MKRLLTAFFFAIVTAGCTQQPSQIATIDLTRIQSNWPKFINYSNQLASDSQAIQSSHASMKDKQAQLAALQARYVAMQDEVTGDIRNAAAQIAQQKNYKLVVTRQYVGYGGVDITPDVEAILKITEKSPQPAAK